MMTANFGCGGAPLTLQEEAVSHQLLLLEHIAQPTLALKPT